MPRREGGAYSARKVPAPAYSPDAENPWIMRNRSRPMAPAIPIAEYVGRSPMKNVDPDMMRPGQGPAATPSVPPCTPHNSSNGSQDKGHGEYRKCRHQLDGLVCLREESKTDDGSQVTVRCVIEPLNEVSDKTCCRSPPQRATSLRIRVIIVHAFWMDGIHSLWLRLGRRRWPTMCGLVCMKNMWMIAASSCPPAIGLNLLAGGQECSALRRQRSGTSE